jgi:biotin operon repressor
MDLMVKAMKTKVGNPLRKLVLLKLADNASDQGECWPSYQYIADQCEISKRAVQLHIKALEKTGVLTKTIRKGLKGNSSNVYILNFHLLVAINDGKTFLLPSAPDSPPSESSAPPSESDALGGGEPDAPRTSHSLEPINEPVSEPIDLLSDSGESNELAVVDDSVKFDAKAKTKLLTEAFESFWLSYQKKSGRKNALGSFQKIKLPNDQQAACDLLQNIIDQAKQWGDLYASTPAGQKQYQPHPATWINNERWNDEEMPTIRQPQGFGGPQAPAIAHDNRQGVNSALSNIHDTDW